MSACEKCWADAGGSADEYRRLLDERRDAPCTPEEQAGPDSGTCPWCHRRTLHQHTGECMYDGCGATGLRSRLRGAPSPREEGK